MKTCIVLTGGLGLLGSEVFRRILKWDSQSEVVLLIREKGNLSGKERFYNLWNELKAVDCFTSLDRVQILESQLDAPLLGLTSTQYSDLTLKVTDIFHLASDVRLDLPLEQARQSNVTSTQQLIHLALQAKQLRGFHYFSTYAVCRSEAESFFQEKEISLSGRFRNTYEQTKAEAETLLYKYRDHFPVSIYRSSLIVGDSHNGWTSKFDAFYLAIRLFLDGLFKDQSIPVPKDAKIDAIHLDSVADAFYFLARQTPVQKDLSIYHLTSGNQAPSLFHILAQGAQYLNLSLEKYGFPRRSFPNFVEVEKLEETFNPDIFPDAESAAIFRKIFKYIVDPNLYDHSNTIKALSDSSILIHSVEKNLSKILDFAIRTDWGRKSESRPPLYEPLKTEPIAIVGIGSIHNPDSFEFDHTYFKIPPITSQSIDRLQKQVLIAANQALRDSGEKNGDRFGMILGYGDARVENDFVLATRPAWNLLKSKLKTSGLTDLILKQIEEKLCLGSPFNEDSLAGGLPNVAVGRVMNFFDLKGPCYVVNTGDSSSLAAIDLAVDSLRTRECDLVLAGGAFALNDEFLKLSLEQEEKNLPIGEGAGFLVLKRWSDATLDQNKIYGIIRGIGRAANGKKYEVSKTHSNIQSEAVSLALTDAKLSAHEVIHLEGPKEYLGGTSGVLQLIQTLNSENFSNPVGISSSGDWGQAYHLIVEPNRKLPLAPDAFENSPIAVVGMGTILPNVKNPEEFWQLIQNQKTSISPMPGECWEGNRSAFFDLNPEALDRSYSELGAFSPNVDLDPVLFGIPPSVIEKMDPIQKQFLYAAHQATQSLSLPEKTGLVVGESKSGSRAAWKITQHLLYRKVKSQFPQIDLDKYSSITDDSRSGYIFATALARFAKFKNIRAGHLQIDAACASSLAALSVAARELRLGKMDCVISGGVGISVTPAYNIPFSKCRALATKKSLPFDEKSDGIVLGEGSVVFVLKRYSDALKNRDPIYGILKGIAGSSDGRGSSMIAPSSDGQALAMKRALEQSDLSANQIQYLECHATGTPVGDVSELIAIAEAYRTSQREIPLKIGSVKGQIGHTIGAAGSAGLLKTLLAFQNETYPPMPLTSKMRTEPGIQLVTRSEPWISGASRQPRRAGISAFGFGGTNWHMIVEQASQRPTTKKTAALFPGHGSPYPNMGYELYQRSHRFRAAFQEANSFFVARFGQTLEGLIFTENGKTESDIQQTLFQTEYVQPILLATSFAFYQVFLEYYPKIDVFLGHSIGELTALAASGAIPFEIALEIAFQRGKIYRDLKNQGIDTGQMLAIPGSNKNPIFQSKIAVVNSPEQFVLSGTSAEILQIHKDLKKAHEASYILPVEVAWHSDLAKGLGEEKFSKLLGQFEFESLHIPVFNNVTLDLYQSANQIPGSLVRQLGEKLDFQSCIEKLAQNGVENWIEIGPRTLLKKFVSKTLQGKPFRTWSIDSIPKKPLEVLRQVSSEVQLAT